MDAFDRKILDHLQRDGRLTNGEVATRVGLSASQCSRRRAALEAAGIITGYTALVAPAAVGCDVQAFVQVTLARHSPDNAARFLHLVLGLEEIQAAYALTGEADYLLKIAVPSLSQLSSLLSEVLLSHPSVAHLRSSIVLNRLKESLRLPLSQWN